MEARKPYDIDSLTDVALRVFADKGYDGATMDDVARAAGITKASIYYHVSGKEALLARGLTRALDALFAILAEPHSASGAPAARLRHIVRRVVHTTLDLLPEVSLLFRLRGGSALVREALERRRAFDRIVTGIVEQAQHDGTARPDIDARLVTRLLFGMSNSVVEWYRPGSGHTPDALADALAGLAFEGIAPR